MYIARLQLKGFKSFGGNHDLPLSPGMTAIVGPNGSGKSNLLDALRWVLGDTHTSKLRVIRQGDLLFQGSVSQAPAEEAEVCIQMREGTRVCTIRRKVTDEGGQITVDGKRVTLTELDDTKRIWQLGGDRFAFIGQGDVTEVIQQRPTARRGLLESLFGIDVYRKRRNEASERLLEAKEEYGRLRTFSAELAARREEIAPLVVKATEARKILDDLEEDRRLFYWTRRERCERHVEEIAVRRDALFLRAKEKASWQNMWESSLAFFDGRLSELAGSRKDGIRELDDAKNTLANLTKTAYGFGTSLVSHKRRQSALLEERVEISLRLDNLHKEREVAKRECKASLNEVSLGKARLAEINERYEAMQNAIDRAKEVREKNNAERGSLQGEMETLKGRMRSIGTTLQSLRAEPDPGADDPLKLLKKESDELERRHARLLEEREDAIIQHGNIYAKLQEVSTELQRNRREASKLSSRLSELEEQAQAEVYPRPVQHILSAVHLGRISFAVEPSAVIDAFTCPMELAVAVEAFLGGRQFWILVDTMEDAQTCIEQLKKNSIGRATFLPRERSVPRRRVRNCHMPDDGVIGWAMDLLSPVERWRTSLEHLMGDLVLVESHFVAQDMIRSGFKNPIVTLEGDVFLPSGSISGGKDKKPLRALEIKSTLARLERNVAATNAAVASLTEEFTRLEAEELSASRKKEEMSAAIRELAASRSLLDARREETLRERAMAKNERDRIRKELSVGAARYAELARRIKELERALPKSAPEIDVKAIREMEHMKSALAVSEEKLRSRFVLSERMATETKAVERALSGIDDEISECSREILERKTGLSRIARRYAEVALRRRKLLLDMAESGDRYEAICRGRDRRSRRLVRAKNAYAETISKIHSCDADLGASTREREELILTWEEQYPYPETEVRGPFSTNPDELRRAIKEKERTLKLVGDVDMGVLSEDKNLSDRLAFLGEQLDDVRSGMYELERLIDDADEQARLVFVGALENIDKKFGALFQRLFGGGDARLVLIEGSSLWESGVDVVARPPGKHPQSIAQLSGGEQSLSAIALLFASLESANCPIAVLDEVDAALDEVNLRRFAELTKDASQERQIFVMTHRRATMERADVLYGITLSEPGLSQVIGVRIDDWA